jgi:hypothetical protein
LRIKGPRGIMNGTRTPLGLRDKHEQDYMIHSNGVRVPFIIPPDLCWCTGAIHYPAAHHPIYTSSK